MTASLRRTDVAWGYAAQLVNIGSGVMLLPVVLLTLSPQQVGLWFVFMTLINLAQLFELAMQPTLSRTAAYVFAGVDGLRDGGLVTAPAGAPLKPPLLAALIVGGRLGYRWTAAIVAACLLVGGSVYLASVTPRTDGATHAALSAWALFAVGATISVYFGYFSAFILGKGEIGQNSRITVLTRGSFVLLAAIGLLSGLELMALGIASLMSCVAGRWLAHHYFRPIAGAASAGQGHHPSAREVISTLWPNAWRLFVVQLGGFLIIRASTLVVTSFLGLTPAASYGLALQLLLLISGVASLLAVLQLPRMNAAQVERDKRQLQRAVGLSVVSAWILFALGGALLLFLGQDVLALMGRQAILLETPMLSAMLLIAFLEMNHSIAAHYLTTLNKVPFTGAAILSGVAIVGLATALCAWTPLGLWGVVLAQGLVQLGYNNWKWPLEALRDLEVGVLELLRVGFGEMRRLMVLR